MKIAILSDVHAGVKNDSKYMLDYQEKFFNDIFFPELEKRNIKTIFQMGDIFDRRKYINFETLYKFRKIFFDRLASSHIEMKAILGNHDIYHKNTNRINAFELLLDSYDNIEFILNDGKEFIFDGVKFLFVPWVNMENHDSIVASLNASSADVVIGHFELSGFALGNGAIAEHSTLDEKHLNKFPQVYSGHYHVKSSRGNIKYLGTPFELTWGDCDDEKGFYIYDTDERSMEFIPNPHKLHEKVFYNDTNPAFLSYLEQIDYTKFSGKNVKLFVEKKKDKKVFEKFVENMYKIDTIEFTILEDMSEFHSSSVDVLIDATTSTSELIKQYVDNVETEMDKKKIGTIMNHLYLEALMENKK